MKSPAKILDRVVDIMLRKHEVDRSTLDFNVCNLGFAYLYRADPFVVVCGNYFKSDMQLVTVVFYDRKGICVNMWHIGYDELI